MTMKRYSTTSNILLVFIICAFALSACSTVVVPKEGVWYNEELMIEIDFNQAIDKWKPIVRMYNQDGTYQSAVCMFGYVGEFSIRDDNLMVYKVYLEGDFNYRNGVIKITLWDEEAQKMDDYTYIFERIDVTKT